jgi:acetyl esterase/lipase
VVAQRLVREGFVVVAPNYRLSPGVQHPAHVEDAAAAVAWVAGNIGSHGGDPAKIYLSGHSAGAYLAVLLALDPSQLRGQGVDVATLAGTVAISPFLYVEETARERPKVVWGNDPADWLAASVSPHIASGKGPMLLIYADGDDPWRKEQNERFVREMTAAGNRNVRAVEVADRDHLTIHSAMAAEDDAVGDLIVEFVRRR